MKILQINKYFYLRGGAERYFFDLSEMLSKNGNEVIPFAMAASENHYSKYNRYFINKVNLDKFSIKNIIKVFYNYDAAIRLNKLIKETHPDVVHLHNIYHQLSPAIINVLKKHNIPIAQTIHDYKLICPNYKLFNQNSPFIKGGQRGIFCRKCAGGKYYNCFKDKCVKKSYGKSFIAMAEAYLHNKILHTYDKVDVFLAHTNFVKNILIEFGIAEERIKIITPLLNNSIISEKEKSPSFMDEKYLLFFGRLEYEKGIDVLLNALSLASRELKIKIVGRGPYQEELKKKIKKLKLNEKVEMAGFKHGKELKHLINNGQAVIIPSICPETLCYSLLEAMAMGKIVIASRIGGMREIIQDGVNGFLFEAGNSNELAEKINNLDKFDLNKIGRNAKNSVLKFNEEKHYMEIMDVYDNLKCHKL